MPTTRKRTSRNRTTPGLEPWQVEFILTGKVLRDDGGTSVKPYIWREEFNGCFSAWFDKLPEKERRSLEEKARKIYKA